MERCFWLFFLLLLPGCAGREPAAPKTPSSTPAAVRTPERAASEPPKPDLGRLLEERYEDLGYAFTTRNVAELEKFLAQPAEDSRRALQECMDLMNSLEQEVQTTFRCALVTKILDLKPEGPHRATVRVRMLVRFRDVPGKLVCEAESTGTHVWVQRDGVWKIAEDSGFDNPRKRMLVNGKEVDWPARD